MSASKTIRVPTGERYEQILARRARFDGMDFAGRGAGLNQILDEDIPWLLERIAELESELVGPAVRAPLTRDET